MAICRWSTEKFSSDVYVYESYDGIEIHVASRRLVLAEPLPDLPDLAEPGISPESWLDAHKQRRGIIDRSQAVCIGGPFDGESFVEADNESALRRLAELADAGYRVPTCAWDILESGQMFSSRERLG